MPVTATQRREYQALTRPIDSSGLLAIHWARHARASVSSIVPIKMLRFPRYMQRGLGLDHVWEVPLLAFGETRKRVNTKRGGKPIAST